MCTKTCIYLLYIYMSYNTKRMHHNCFSKLSSVIVYYRILIHKCIISFQCVAIITIFEFCALLSFYYAWNLEGFRYQEICWVQMLNVNIYFLVNVGPLIHKLHCTYIQKYVPKTCNFTMFYYV
jgi:hypothetical protein